MSEATDPQLELQQEPVSEPVQEAEVAPETPEVEAEPETVEVEMDGQTYSVPAALRDSFMKAADYTQKTQALADERRQVAEEHQKRQEQLLQAAQRQSENIALYGRREHVQGLLEEMRKVDWLALSQNDPEAAQQLSLQRENLRDQLDSLEDEIERREHDARAMMERNRADRMGRLEETLARDIPNYTPDLRKEMDQTAFNLGFTEREVASVTDPRMMRVLHLAMIGAKVSEQQSAKPKPNPVTPVTKVSSGKATPSQGPKDEQKIDDWMKARNRQVKRRA